MANAITMRQMLEAGVHYGHKKRFWNPKMSPYIFGVRHQIHIINLEYTLPLYREAINFLSGIAAKKGKILFVGTKRAAQEIIREEATRCGMPYVDHRWLGGMLTNYKTIRQSIRRFKELETMQNEGGFDRLIKKEALMLTRELKKLQSSLNGIKEMGGLPDALFIIDIGHEKTAIAEAKRLGIPIVGIVDTNYDPSSVDYVVPGNDDSQRAIQLYCQGIADAILDVRQLLNEQQVAEAAKEPKESQEPKQKVVVKKVSRGTPLESKATKVAYEGGAIKAKPIDVQPKTAVRTRSPRTQSGVGAFPPKRADAAKATKPIEQKVIKEESTVTEKNED